MRPAGGDPAICAQTINNMRGHGNTLGPEKRIEIKALRLPERKPHDFRNPFLFSERIQGETLRRTPRGDPAAPFRIAGRAGAADVSFKGMLPGAESEVFPAVPVLLIMNAFLAGFREIGDFVPMKARPLQFRDAGAVHLRGKSLGNV